MHTLRLPDGGDLLPEAIERFWSKVDKTRGPDACWTWTGATDKDGYGKFQVSTGYKTQWHVRAHRFALLLVVGRHLKDLALHSCDNPPCCNPKHLHAGTQQKNRGDCKARGRVARGETDGNARFTAANILEMRRRRDLGEKLITIANDFDTYPAVVSLIAHRKTWAHLP